MLIRSKVATTVENISQVTNQRVLVNDAIQIALDRVYQWHDWPYYIVESFFNTIADYNTGTVAVVKGSQTVTTSGATLTATMLNRKIRIGSSKAYYRITNVNLAGILTIDAPFQDTTVTAAGFEIYKDEYRLASDVDKYKTLRQMQNGVPLLSLSPTQFDLIVPAPQNFADPTYEINTGTAYATYTTGTVTASGTTITGAGTLWLTGVGVDGMGSMSLIRIGNDVYNIKSVDSDTQITTYETVTTAAAGSTYEITLNNIIVQLHYIPNSIGAIRYRYFRMPHPMANDYDIPDMPHEFHHILVHGALSIIWQQKGDMNNHQLSIAEFDRGLQDMKVKLGSFAPNRINKRKSVDNIKRRRFDAVENGNFDWKYSA